jgi:hypothetical protein
MSEKLGSYSDVPLIFPILIIDKDHCRPAPKRLKRLCKRRKGELRVAAKRALR